MSWNKAYTDGGRALIASTPGNILRITKACAGSGRVPVEELAEQGAVSGYVMDLPIVEQGVQGEVLEMRMQLDTSVVGDGFDLYQIGLYAQLFDAEDAAVSEEKLVLLVQADRPDAIRKSLLVSEYILNLYIGQPEELSVNLEHGAYVTVAMFQDLRDDLVTMVGEGQRELESMIEQNRRQIAEQLEDMQSAVDEQLEQNRKDIEELLEESSTELGELVEQAKAPATESRAGAVKNLSPVASAVSYSGNNYDLTVENFDYAKLAGLANITFKAPATATADGVSVSVNGGAPLPLYSGAEAAEAESIEAGQVYTISLDKEGAKAYFTGGGTGGGGLGGKRFDQYELPYSTAYTASESWERRSTTAYGQYAKSTTLGNESYIVNNDSTVIVYNHLTALSTSFALPKSVNIAQAIPIVAFDSHIFIMGRVNASQGNFKINVITKVISEFDTTYYSMFSGAISSDDGIYWVTNNITATNYGSADSVGDILYISSGTGAMTNIAKFPWQNRNNSYRGFWGVAIQKIGKSLYFATSYKSTTGYSIKDAYIYSLNIGSASATMTNAVPAFQILSTDTDDMYKSAYGFNYDSKYYIAVREKLYEYDFPSNKIIKTLPNIPNPNYHSISIYENSLVLFGSGGYYELPFVRGQPDASVGGVLEIYKGQQYRGEKDLVIEGKCTIKPEWQTAPHDIVIKTGEYTSPGGYKVYVKNK